MALRAFVRKPLDIGWKDLCFAAGAALLPIDGTSAEGQIEDGWPSRRRDVVTFLSVRSGFDAVLTALALPVGSEVLLSAITVPHMSQIVRAHGLVPVPVDLDMDRLAMDVVDLERAVSPSSRVVVVAHLFGSRMPMEPAIDVARRHGLFVIEDCAQAYVGPAYAGSAGADVSMFSFGIIKTASALGGAVLMVTDDALRAKLLEIQARYPRQSRRTFLARVVKVASLKAVSGPRAFYGLVSASRLIGRDLDAIILRSTRGFSGPDILSLIRSRPSIPQLALLARRLRRFDALQVAHRRALAESFAASLSPQVDRPGKRAAEHSHWLFPIETTGPDALVRRLAHEGFDATRGGASLHVVEPPMSRPDGCALRATRTLSRVVYLPVHRGVPAASLEFLAEIVNASTAPNREIEIR